MNPRTLAAWTREALDHHRAGRGEPARALYERVLLHAPQDPRALHGLGVLLQDVDPMRALDLLRASIAVRPDAAIYHNSLANLFRARGRVAEAEAAYREAVRLDRRYANAWLNLSVLLRVEGRTDDAIACLEHGVAAEPARAATYNDLGALYQLRGRVEPALACFERACELAPALGEAHFNRGKLLEDLGRNEEARASYERAREHAPQLRAEIACHLAVVARRLCD
ncbi:MAG TPA: tetratricopeptide repeat protein, partial [Myxococcota bacterium]|nr:tetratricopeptide repeat protein [Myxococcota bacterium]